MHVSGCTGVFWAFVSFWVGEEKKKKLFIEVKKVKVGADEHKSGED